MPDLELDASDYEATLDDQAAQSGQAPPAAKAPNPYEDTLDAQQQGLTLAVRKGQIDAGPVDPDKAAQASQIGRQLGVPTPVVLRNFDAMQARAQAGATPYDQIAATSPATAAAAADPSTAPVVKDDLEPLGFLEWLLKAPARALAGQSAQATFLNLRYQSLFRDLTASEQQQLDQARTAVQANSKLGTEDSWFRKAIVGAVSAIPDLWGATQQGIRYALPASVAGAGAGMLAGGETGATIGLAGGPAAPATVPAAGAAGAMTGGLVGFTEGASAGFGAGMATYFGRVQAAQAYDELLNLKDETGRPIDPAVARMAAFVVGGINAGLQTYGLEYLLHSIPGLGQLTGSMTLSAVKEALRVPTVRAALGEAATEFGKQLTTQAAVQMGSKAISIMGTELAKFAPAGTVPGLVQPGNVNLFKQPAVQSPDGTVSTVDSISIDDGAGHEVLIPRVTPDGRHLSTPDAIAEYRKTGLNLGTFKDVASANAFAEQLHQDYAKGVYGQAETSGLEPSFPNLTTSHPTSIDVARQVLDAGKDALTNFALLTLPGPLMGIARDAMAARQAEGNVAFFTALGQGVEQSKTAARDAATAQTILGQAAANGGIPDVYAPVDTWSQYWQSKGVDPREMATAVTGDPDAFDQSIRTGEDLKIPTARYATTIAGTEHNAFFANELRMAPDEMNARESAAFREAVGKGAPAEAPLEPGEAAADQVQQALAAQLVQAGYPQATADQYAALHRSVFATLATRAGLDPLELYQRYGLQIRRQLGEEPAAAGRPVDEAPPTAAQPGLPVAPELEPGPEAAETPSEAPGASEPLSAATVAAVRDAPADHRGLVDVNNLTPEHQAELAQHGLIERYDTPDGPVEAVDPAAVVQRARATLAGRGAEPREGEQLPGGHPERPEAGEGRGTAAAGPRAGLERGGVDALSAGDREDFAAHLTGARERGYAGTDDELADRYADQLDQAHTIAEDLAHDETEATTTPEDLLRAVAKAGGIGIAEETGMKGEARGLLDDLHGGSGLAKRFNKEGRRTNRVPRMSAGAKGIPNVVRQKGGIPFDRALEAINEDPRFAGRFENLSDFVEALHRAAQEAVGTRPRKGGATAADVQSVLRGLLNVTPESHWWEDNFGPADVETLEQGGVEANASGESEASLEAIRRQRGMQARGESYVVYNRAGERKPLIGPEAVDYHPYPGETYGIEGPGGFRTLEDNGGRAPGNRTEFNQDLFDALEEDANKVDTLSTGEKQPRLPGDVGAVRDQEIAQPKLAEAEDRFELTPPAETEEQQTHLFQPFFHGAPRLFDRFSTDFIGTGEGAASYGWGLYFAEHPGVVEGYHERLAGQGEMKSLRLGSLRLSAANNFDYSSRAHISDLENIRASLAEELMLEEGTLRARAGEAQQVALKALDDRIAAYRKEWPEGVPAAEELRKQLARPGAVSVKFAERPGAVYQVDVPDAQVAKFLDYDEGLERQPPAVLEALKAAELTSEDVTPGGNTWAPWYITRGDVESGFFGPSKYNEGKWASVQFDRYGQRIGYGGGMFDTREEAAANAEYRQGNEDAATRGAVPTGQTAYEALARKFGGDKGASLFLAEHGVPGLKYDDQGSRGKDEGGTHNIVVFDDRIVKITHRDGTPLTAEEKTELGQPAAGEGAGRRGYLSFGSDRQMNIGLLPKADLSTFLHETGHFYLEVMADVTRAIGDLGEDERTPMQAGLLKDMATVRDWVGNDGGEWTTAQHEQFAKGFEQYLMEGKAPSVELRSAFAKFRAWLIGVYRTVKGLGVELTPEVRGVFDRLVATDRAIGEAEQQGRLDPMFLTPAAAGMSPDEFKLYADTAADAGRMAREQLDNKLLEDVRREQQRQWKEERDQVREQATKTVQAQPVYEALAALQKGTKPDGSPLLGEGGDAKMNVKLDRRMIVDRYGKDRLAALPRPYVYARTGGMDPDVVADMFGYSSGDELTRALAAAPKERDAIERETDRVMLDRHGSALTDGTIYDKAANAAANQSRELVLKAELRALVKLQRLARPFIAAGEAKVKAERAERDYERRWFEAEHRLQVAIAEGRKQVEIDKLQDELDALESKAKGGPKAIDSAIPPDAVIRAVAEDRVAGTTIHDLRPEMFWSAARRASKDATDSAARQDFDRAVQAKQSELLNLHLFRAMSDAREDVDARVSDMRDLATNRNRRATIGKAGGGYLEQIDGILSRYNFAQLTRKEAARRAQLKDWIAAQEGAGVPIDLPADVVNEANRTPFTEMSYDELTGVTDAVRQLVHLARIKNRLLKDQATSELREAVDQVVANIRASKAKIPASELTRDRGPQGENYRLYDSIFASHTKIASYAYQFDGFKDGGAAWEHFIRPLNEAATRETELNRKATEGLGGLVEDAYPGLEARKLYDRTYLPSVDRSLSKMERLMIALNWGNEGNRQRLRVSEKWSDAQVKTILDTLDARDWKFVQGTWDLIDSYWGDIAAKQKRVTGVEPTKVEPSPITTAFGEQRGGYFPIKYDDRLSAKAGAHLDLETGSLQKAAAYVKATTSRGHTVERLTNVNMPLRLDFGVITEHLRQVIHDLAYHETLIDAGRVLGHPEVQKAIYEHYGDVVHKQFKNALRDSAIGTTPGNTAFERSVNYLRAGVTMGRLGWNMMNALYIPLSLTQAAVRIGPYWVAHGMSRWLRDAVTMENSINFINEKSEFMKDRGMTQSRELSEIRNQVGIDTGRLSSWTDAALRGISGDHVTKRAVVDSYLWLLEKTQKVADVPTWLGQYEKSMQETGGDEAKSVAIADQAVTDSHGDGSIHTLAEVQRGGPLLKLWTAFYSFFNTTYNLSRTSVARTKFNNPVAMGRLASDMFLLYVVPGSLGYMLRAAVTGSPPGKQNDAKKWIVGLGRENLAYAMNTMVGLRELAGAVEGWQGYEGPAGASAFAQMFNVAQQTTQAGENAIEGKDEHWKALLNATADAGGTLFHFPTVQARRTLEGIAALSEGKTHNPFAVIGGYSDKGQ